MREVIDANITKAQSSEVIRELSLSKNEYFLISVHRQENVDPPERLKEILNILIKISEQFNQKILVSLHPRTKKRIKDITDISLPENIIFHEPFSYSDYLQLQLNARVTISDSGTISEESSILNFPAINLRDTHERPEAMEEAAVMMTGINLERILNAIHMLELAGQDQSLEMQIPLDYQSRNVSEKVCRIILSYTDYIKKYIWLE
jgi:UDP-N-acetylglucosamine 2-epimerase (non-hydrolysing)